jgi:cation diffusion facilitator CzcD-associated flavoprotein CzcO
MNASDLPKTAIIGAGPAGLAAGRALLAHGIPFEIFEKHSDAGGVWDMENPGSPMYSNAHFISSKTMSGFAGYPMPEDYPDYPSNRQILSYVRAFARDMGLYPHIRLSQNISRAERTQTGWRLHLQGGEPEEFSHLIAAPGTNWAPSRPDIPGTFSGEIFHSIEYKRPDQFEGKRVLIVGAGNSGCDIACDAARSASKAFISMRRGYHFLPKHIFGKPADVFAATGPKLPMWAAQRIFGLLLRVIVGDITRVGLPKPDHRLFESHPILNDQIIHHLRHGDISVRPDVERFDGGFAVFKDGTREEVDLVILATGYDWPVPFIDRSILAWRDERPELYLNVFAPQDERLFIMGFIDSNGGIYAVMDDAADLVARAIKARSGDIEAHKRLRALTISPPPDISGGIKFIKTARHTHYADSDAYKKELKLFRGKLGWDGIAALAG